MPELNHGAHPEMPAVNRRKPAGGGWDADLRPVIPVPPMGEGYFTEPGSTHRNGMPARPYRYLDGADVTGPAEIVRCLRKRITDAHPELGPWSCCRHCGHGADEPPHFERCPKGCNEAEAP